MRATELIGKKRDGGELTREELFSLIESYTRDAIPDYQMAAWAMAVFFRGQTPGETVHLTEAMLRSGEVLDFSDVPGVKVDKHSTGGVGDKTSLVLAPAVAAAGVPVPMISGRGLGHSGGTLDKLEAIPGFSVNLTLEEFRRAVRTVGCALIGQTKEIAPADKKLYALRDLTGTIASVPLICGSILSKKLAEGIDALVLDVKVGSGAFMKDLGSATHLAESLKGIAERMGKRVVALLTDMDQPLGAAAGNALEVAEAIETLKGGGPEDFCQLCRELSAWMLLLGGKAGDVEEGRKLYDQMIHSGKAAEKFKQIIAQQGGDARVVDEPGRLPRAREREELRATENGYLVKVETERLGWAAMALGAGRQRVEDSIDPAVGLVFHKKIGDRVEQGEALATLHYNQREKLAEARPWLEGAFAVAPEPVSPPRLIHKTLTPFQPPGRAASGRRP
ncbi:MAG: thymidine phosphorylase [Terriglobia bacterium]